MSATPPSTLTSTTSDATPVADPDSTNPTNVTETATSGFPVLNLRPHQIEHFHRVMAILSIFYFMIDGSEMGLGKTYIAAAIAIMLKLPCIVVCPLGARQTWIDVFTTYGIQVYQLEETGGIITYDCLRSRKTHQPKHGLLVRDDSGDSPVFFTTTLFTRIVQAGVFVIFDESQKLKNTSDQYKAARALIKQFYAIPNNKSRFCLLSGTAIDKAEQAVNLLRMVGFIESRNLYSKIRGQVRKEGIEELLTWARRINKTKTDEYELTHRFRPTRAGAVQYVFDLFIEVIKPGVMSIMPRPAYNGIKDVKNGYYVLEPEDEEEYRCAIGDLSRAVRFNPETGTVLYTKDNMGAITTALVRLQNAKKRTMRRVANEWLNKQIYNTAGERLTFKLILFADYYEVIDYLMEVFADFHPVELSGRIKEHQRTINKNAFNEPNANVQVMIGNPIVGGLSVNLHDTIGLFPRVMLMMPNYRANETHQATGRGFRDGVIGTFVVRFFYGKSGMRENSIMAAMARKGEVMQKVHKEQSDYGVKFPNEYEDEYEGPPPGSETALTNPHRHTNTDDVSEDEEAMIQFATNAMRNLMLNPF